MINKKRIAGIFILFLLVLYAEYASATPCPSLSTGVNAALCDVDND
ncbi:hypothetical protein HYT26_04990, partial [Candidatus Pacearchaeota archaeon]|nr:hypothetical protein [Candidatus Pacearchaeota archaeon]